METREIEKIYVHDEQKKEYAKKGVANTALGLSIGALGWLLLGGNNGLGKFGIGASSTPNAECAEFLNLTEMFYKGQLAQQAERFSDRQVINGEMFAIYNKGVNDNFNLYKSQIDADFGLYKNQRDQFDVLKNEIDSLKCQVAVSEAVRPYQDALINCKIDRNADMADWNLDRRTCRMITGELVLPNSPTVTGFPSYNGGCSRVVTQSPSATVLAGKAA